MLPIPEDIGPIIRDIDQSLKDKSVPPHSRPIMAVIEFGKRFRISIPLVKPPLGAREDLVKTSVYTAQIHKWYEQVYGDLIKVDFSQKARVAVLADGDIWEMRIPLLFGHAVIEATREVSGQQTNKIGTSVIRMNASDALTGITGARLEHFSDADLSEVYGLFHVGLDVRHTFDRFRKSHQKFVEAEDDWATAVNLMTNQSPNWGQARWASLQMCEKFMKGMISIIGDVPEKQGHNLNDLHDALAVSIRALDLKHLLADVQCPAAVRYGEAPSTREQAYAAHKSGLLVVRVLGGVRYPSG
jgi:hypothetical protein